MNEFRDPKIEAMMAKKELEYLEKGTPITFPEDADIPDYPARKQIKWALLGIGVIGLMQLGELAYLYLAHK